MTAKPTSPITGLRADWNRSRSEPALPLGTPAPWIYAFSVAYLLVCYLLASDDRPNQFYREGGLVDCLSGIYLATGAVLAWLNWRVRSGGGPLEKAFWLLSSAGLAVLALDERFQFHERMDLSLLEQGFDAPWFGKNWNDVIVMGYGVGALVVFLVGVPTLCRERAVRGFLALGFASYFVHSAIDAAFARSATTELIEEPFKLLAGASFMLAFLQALRNWGAAGARRTIGAIDLSSVVLLSVAFVTLAFYPSFEWLKWTYYRWGDPTAWLSMILFGAAALLLAMSRPRGRREDPLDRWFWRAIAALFGSLALSEATVAARSVLRGADEHDILDDRLWKNADVLHGGVSFVTLPWVVAFLLVLGVCCSGGLHCRRSSRFAATTAALLLCVIVVTSLVEPGRMGYLTGKFWTSLLIGLAAATGLTTAASVLIGRAGGPREE